MNADLATLEETLVVLERTRAEPVWFMEQVLGLKGDRYYLDDWQKELAEAVGDVYRKQAGIPTRVNHDGKPMITVRAMHGPGKTFTVAAIMHWFNCAFRGRIICTAPKEKQITTRLWPAFRKIAVRAGKEYAAPIDVANSKITWHDDEDWCALAETAAQPENLAGYHDEYMLIIVDEASGVNEQMFPVIEGMASAGTIVIILLIGNPTKNIGTFHASHCIAKVAKNYHQVHVDLDKTTRVSKQWVQRMIDKYGENSPVVKVRCLGEFADSDEAQLIAYSWLAAAQGREVGGGSLRRLRVAVDVADGGANFTTVTAAWLYDDGSVLVIKQRQFSFPTAESSILSAQAAEQMFKDYDGRTANGDDFVVDSLGVGTGTAGELMRLGYSIVVYKGGAGSDDSTMYRNRRTQSYIVMRDAHRDGKIGYAEDFLVESEGVEGDWDDFTAQMCSVRTKPGTERTEELETKEAMMKRGIASPDRADGCAMLFATQEPTLPTQINVVAVGGMMSNAQGDWNA